MIYGFMLSVHSVFHICHHFIFVVVVARIMTIWDRSCSKFEIWKQIKIKKVKMQEINAV